MKGSRISSRYAKSLLGLAKETGKLDRLYTDMKLVSDTCDESKELSLLLKSPIVKAGKKIQILDEIFYSQLDDMSKSFLELITKGGREGMLVDIALEFQEQYKREKKIITALVTSAYGLDDSLRKKVLKIVKDATNSEVELVEREEKDLIGGLILRIGDRQCDASIQKKLNDLRKSFSEQKYSDN